MHFLTLLVCQFKENCHSLQCVGVKLYQLAVRKCSHCLCQRRKTPLSGRTVTRSFTGLAEQSCIVTGIFIRYSILYVYVYVYVGHSCYQNCGCVQNNMWSPALITSGMLGKAWAVRTVMLGVCNTKRALRHNQLNTTINLFRMLCKVIAQLVRITGSKYSQL